MFLNDICSFNVKCEPDSDSVTMVTKSIFSHRAAKGECSDHGQLRIHATRIDYFGCFAPKYFFMAQYTSASNSINFLLCGSDEPTPEQGPADERIRRL